ncbi:MAG: SRPBCC family protein [Bacteroidia bacterium]
MKFIKYLLILVVVAVVVFIGSGLLRPSQTYSSEITVEKSIEEAWAVMQDDSKTSQWLKSITDVKHVSGDKGKVGGVTEYTFTDDGQESKVLETITSVVPNEHIAMDFVMPDVMTMDYKMEISEKDGKTHIKSSTIAEGTGLFMQSMFSFMGSSLKAQEDENMNNLKEVIDNNTTDYFPVPEPIEEVEVVEVVGNEG